MSTGERECACCMKKFTSGIRTRGVLRDSGTYLPVMICNTCDSDVGPVERYKLHPMWVVENKGWLE